MVIGDKTCGAEARSSGDRAAEMLLVDHFMGPIFYITCHDINH